MKIIKDIMKNLILMCIFSCIYVSGVYAAKETNTYRVGVYGDRAPYEAYDIKENSVEGIMIDYLSLIADNTGLVFEYVCVDSKEEMTNKLNDGQIDIVAFVPGTGNEPGISLSESCFSDKMIIVVEKDKEDSLYDSDGIRDINTSLRAGIVEGYGIYEELIEQEGIENYRYYTSYKTCMDGVIKNEVDYVILPELYVHKMVEHPYYDNISVYSYPDGEYSVYIGISDSCEPELSQLINEEILRLDNNTKEQILLNNVILNRESPDGRDFVAVYKKYVYGIFGSIAVIMLLLLIRKLVENRDKSMEATDDIVRAYAGIQDTDIAVRSKEMLLSKLSHDMKNPMNSIMGMTELARDNVNSPDLVYSYLDDIMSAGKYLLSLINDILDMARIESGKMVLKKENVRLSEVLCEINTMFLPLVKKKNLKFTYNEEGNSNVTIVADKHRLQQIIINVVGNAVKFTREGGNVALSVNISELNNKKINVFIRVKDSGIGVSDEVKLRLFEPFFQENRHGERSGGTGLGLTIVNELVNLMDGHINFASELGKGTEVKLRFSFDRGNKADTTVISDKEYVKAFDGKCVLAADDSDLNLDMLEGFLEKYNMKVDRARNGESCYRKFVESDENYYQFVILDINMPDMNGDKVAERIRKSERADAGNIKIIGLSAEEYSEEEKRILYANMDGYMVKPMESKVLFKLLYDLIG